MALSLFFCCGCFITVVKPGAVFLKVPLFLVVSRLFRKFVYVATLDTYGTIWKFFIVLILAVVLSVISERISEIILNMNK